MSITSIKVPARPFKLYLVADSLWGALISPRDLRNYIIMESFETEAERNAFRRAMHAYARHYRTYVDEEVAVSDLRYMSASHGPFDLDPDPPLPVTEKAG